MAIFDYRIHPSVGIARMGDSPDAYFVGRELPEDRLTPALQLIPGGNAANVSGSKPFRDKNDLLAKQAGRFRIFCYYYDDWFAFTRDAHPEEVWEVTAADYDIEWRVKVANLKSMDTSIAAARGAKMGGLDADFNGKARLANVPDERQFNTAVPADVGSLKAFQGKAGAHHANPRVDLGGGILEAGGQLLVLGSGGKAQQISGRVGAETGLRWENWEDDSADGYVRATVTPKSGSSKKDKDEAAEDARQAWVVISVPDYGVDTPPSPSLYEIALNHALTHTGPAATYLTAPITYHANIRPIVRAYVQNKYVSPEARRGMPANPGIGHLSQTDAVYQAPPSAAVAALIHALVRTPWKTRGHRSENYWTKTLPSSPVWVHSGGGRDYGMPKLEYLAYPELVYQWLSAWASGSVAPGNASLMTSSLAIDRPWLLDLAHLGWMSGGSFYPGIETGRDVHDYLRWTADWGTNGRHVDIRFGDPTRNPSNAAVPGEMTMNLAVPWQSDFYACKNRWWPSSRPVEVTQAGRGSYYDWMHGVAGGADLVTKWAQLGFIRYDAGSHGFVEESRLLPTP